MDKDGLQRYLREKIPLTQTMGMQVVRASSEEVILSAPLPPNINHQGTVFAGSASATALLAAWGLLFFRLRAEGFDGRGVVAKNTMSYYRPITGTFTASAKIPSSAIWQEFVDTLTQKGKARISLKTVLICQENKVAELEGEFVAFHGPKKQ